MQAAARFREAIAILEHARDRAASCGCDLDLAERAATAVRDTVLRECIAAGLYANPSLLGDGSPIRVSSGVDAALMDEEDPPTALVASAPATPPFSPCAAEFTREGGELVDPVLSGVKALLIDLDGTMYSPSGPIPGADEFYGYLLRQRLPYVFLSNTGAKGAHGVQAKLAKNGFLLQAAPVPTDNIYTAAQAPRPPAVTAVATAALTPLLLRTRGAGAVRVHGGPHPAPRARLCDRRRSRGRGRVVDGAAHRRGGAGGHLGAAHAADRGGGQGVGGDRWGGDRRGAG